MLRTHPPLPSPRRAPPAGKDWEGNATVHIRERLRHGRATKQASSLPPSSASPRGPSDPRPRVVTPLKNLHEHSREAESRQPHGGLSVSRRAEGQDAAREAQDLDQALSLTLSMQIDICIARGAPKQDCRAAVSRRGETAPTTAPQDTDWNWVKTQKTRPCE